MLGILRRTVAALAASSFALALSSCGGGGGGGGSLPTAPVVQPTQAPPTALASAKIVVTVPPKNPGTKYVSPSTQSMTIGLVSGSTTTPLLEVDLTLASPGCAGVAGGGIVCTVLVSAPFGPVTFSVSAYDQTGGKGHVLSTGNIAATLVAGTPTTVPLVLGGVAVAATVVLGASSFPVGQPGSVNVTVDAYDAGGNVIIGPGAFATPITLSITGDPYGTLSLSSPTIASPGQIETLNYNGGSVVAAQITPSGTGLTGTLKSAAFGASGINLNNFAAEYNISCAGTPAFGALLGNGVAALSNGTAAVLFASFSAGNCPIPNSIAIANPTGLPGNLFAGDTTDPYNPGTVPAVMAGITWVHTMNTGIQVNPGGAFSSIAAGPNNTVYYSAQFTTTSLPLQTNCTTGGPGISGLIGQLDTTAGTTTETILHGYPYQIKSDSNGNVYFVEYEGTCSTTGANLLDGTTNFQYAVGNIINGTLTENTFTSVGIASTTFAPSDMAVAPDGSAMYIADNENPGQIALIPITNGTFGTAVLAPEPLAHNPSAIAAGDDGSVAWFTSAKPVNSYYWGYTPLGTGISSATMHEQPFATFGFNTNSMTYADGSYFAAGSQSGAGIARMASLAGTPLVSSIPIPQNPALSAISAGGGYVWAVDYVNGNVYSLQYGAPKSGIVNPSARRASVAPRGEKPKLHRH
jgi:hypothetical protein